MEKSAREFTAGSLRLQNINFQDGRNGLLGQVAMVSKTTNRGLALKSRGRVNCLFLPMGIVSRAKTGGGYSKKEKRLQKVTGGKNRLNSSHSS